MSLLAHTYKRIRRLARELAKFGSVGAIAFVITFGCFNLFRQGFGWGPLTSNTLATALATTFAYYANRYWTFRNRSDTGNMGREYVLFFVLNVIGLAITQAFLVFTHYVLHLRGTFFDNAALFVGTGVATMFRYYAYKRWVFAPAKKKAPAPAAVPVVATASPMPAPVPQHPAAQNPAPYQSAPQPSAPHVPAPRAPLGSASGPGLLRRPSGRPHLRQARARVARAETVTLSELFQ